MAQVAVVGRVAGLVRVRTPHAAGQVCNLGGNGIPGQASDREAEYATLRIEQPCHELYQFVQTLWRRFATLDHGTTVGHVLLLVMTRSNDNSSCRTRTEST